MKGKMLWILLGVAAIALGIWYFMKKKAAGAATGTEGGVDYTNPGRTDDDIDDAGSGRGSGGAPGIDTGTGTGTPDDWTGDDPSWIYPGDDDYPTPIDDAQDGRGSGNNPATYDTGASPYTTGGPSAGSGMTPSKGSFSGLKVGKSSRPAKWRGAKVVGK